MDLLTNAIPVQLTNIKTITSEAKQFCFQVMNEKEVHFKPGQWMDFVVEKDEIITVFDETDYQTLEKRKQTIIHYYPIGGFSFTSVPNPSYFEFISKGWIKSFHPVTRYLHTKAQVGQIFFVSGGFGKMYYEPSLATSYTFIAGGIGITPFLSILRTINKQYKTKLIISTKSLELIPCYDELKTLVDDIYITLTKDNSSNRLNKQKLIDLNLDVSSKMFICGPWNMTKEIVAICQEIGFQQEQIQAEFWDR